MREPTHFELQLDRALYRMVALALDDRQAKERLENVERRLADTPATPMTALARRFGLTSTQIDLLWTSVALSAEPRILVHAETLDGPAARRGLTVGLFARLAGLSAGDGRALARWVTDANPLAWSSLIACEPAAVTAAAPVSVSSRLVAHLAGDDRPEPGIERLDVAGRTFIDDDAQSAALDELRRVLGERLPAVIVLEGGRGTGRRTAIARSTNRRVVAIRARFDGAGDDRLLRALRREAVLLDALPVLSDLSIDPDPAISNVVKSRLAAWIDSQHDQVAITTPAWNLDLDLDRPFVRARWPVAGIDVRRRHWIGAAAAVGVPLELDQEGLDTLAIRYRLGPGGMIRALQSASMGRHPDEPLGAPAIVAGVRHNIAESLGGLAKHVEIKQSWRDLVLGDDTLDQVNALIARVHHSYLVLESWQYRTKMARGQGIAALFSGTPGTGKTMVAGLIAAELGLDLYQVDLSQIVSKWIGETEKQLARVFEAAEQGHALLLFDEADALFGQRSTEIKGATDRYANMEVNYLLQRIESFGGLTILTTNLDASIDKALKRRLASHIIFGAPDSDEREQLWRTLTATGGAPLGKDIDYVGLASMFPTMTGANIRNAVISAAFIAASAGSAAIRHEHLLRAARGEYRSMGHVLADRSTAARVRSL